MLVPHKGIFMMSLQAENLLMASLTKKCKKRRTSKDNLSAHLLANIRSFDISLSVIAVFEWFFVVIVLTLHPVVGESLAELIPHDEPDGLGVRKLLKK